MLSLHWTEAKMSDFNRFISYKSKFQLLKHEIAEKILQAETQSAALEESLRINRIARAKRRRGRGSGDTAGGGGGGGEGGGEGSVGSGSRRGSVVEYDDDGSDDGERASSPASSHFRVEGEIFLQTDEQKDAKKEMARDSSSSTTSTLKMGDIAPEVTASVSPRMEAAAGNESAIANMLAACESAGGYSDL